MARNLLRRCLAILSAAIVVVLPARAQETEIKSVRFRVEPITSAALSITVENLRDSPLLAWHIELSPGGYIESNFVGSLPFPWTAGNGPISPHEARTMRGGSPGPTEPRIAAALFADGYCEGSPAVLEKFYKEIKDRSDELAYWRDALSNVPHGSSTEVTNYLHARIAERAALSRSDPLQIGNRLSGSLQGPRPEWWPARMADNDRKDIEVALRTVGVRFAAAPADATPSLTIRTEEAASTEYTAYIENLRDTPIEAWTIQTVRSPDGGARGNHVTDACISDPTLQPPDFGGGRIRPHEVRRERLAISTSGDGPPYVRLTMVLFEDQSFEGSVEDRDWILKLREREGDDKAYWIEAFREASILGASDVKPYLQRKRAERSAHNAVAANGSGTREVDEAIAALERSPQTFPAWLSMQLSVLEGQHARLTRHLTR